MLFENRGHSLSVLALDAADHQLVKRWGCDNLMLDNMSSIDTFTFSYDRPFTPEIWASIATGKHPREHGVMKDTNLKTWNNPIIDDLSSISNILPTMLSSKFGEYVKKTGAGRELPKTECPTVFDDGSTYCWPGIDNADNLIESWEWVDNVSQGIISEMELKDRMLSNFGKEIGWLSIMSRIGYSIIGVHSHILDIAGHVYADREEKLKQVYKEVDSIMGIVIESVDDLVIISDHGMQVSYLSDPSPGEHSMRAMISTTIEDDLPKNVFKVKEWLESHKEISPSKDKIATIDTDRDHLRALGYID